jgi:DNA repair protein RadC
MKAPSISAMPKEARPYEKYEHYGVQSLSDAELLAIFLRSGTKGCNSIETAAHILAISGNSLTGLYTLSEAQLQKIPGIGKVKSIQLKCIAELSLRISKAKKVTGVKLNDPRSVADYYMESMRHKEEEHIILAMFNSAGRLIKEMEVAVGSVNAAYITPREIFRHALNAGAVSLILLHNHPSGDVHPSEEDIAFTKRVVASGKMIGIPLNDHLIIGENCFFSFCEHDLIT